MTHAHRGTAQFMIEALERVAAAVGLEVRREHLEIGDARLPGGLCRVGERTLCILSDALTAEEEARVLGRALTHFDLDNVYVPPAVRAFLQELAGRPEGGRDGR